MALAKTITKTLDIDVEDVRIDLMATIKSYDLTDTKFIFDIQSSKGLTIDLTGSTAMYVVEYVHNSQTYAIEGDMTVVNPTKISFNLPEELKGYKGTILIGLYVRLTDGTKIDIKDIAVRVEPSIMDNGLYFTAKAYFKDFEAVKAEVILEGEKAKTEIKAIVADVQSTGDTAKAEIKATLPSIQAEVSELKSDMDDVRQGDIFKLINWKEGFINAVGTVQADTPSDKAYVHGHKRFAQNTKVKFNLFSTSTISAVAIGTEAKPIKMLIPGDVQGGGYTSGEYTVLAPYEDLWFVTKKSDITDNQGSSIIIDTSNCDVAQNLKNENAIIVEWEKGYLNEQGLVVEDNAYCHSQLLTIPPYMEISFESRTAKDISTIAEYDSNGSFLRNIRLGTGNMESVRYVSNKETYIRICVLFSGQFSSLSGYAVTMKDYEGEEQKNIILKYGYVGMTGIKESSIENPYRYTNPIELMKGQTIEYYSSGSSSIWGLSECDTNGNFISGIQQGNSKYIHRAYTAERHMFVRVCAKISNESNGQTTNDPIVTEDDLRNIKVYFKPFHYLDVKNSVLYQKKITLIGDSLAYGNKLGNEAVWLRSLALKYDMNDTNMGMNGNPVAIQSKEVHTSMVERYQNIPKSDYIVLIGGANDKRLDVPIGQIDDADPNTFMGALNIIIDGIRNIHPKSKLLFLTNYNRYPSLNSLGKTDIDYVNAMIDVCRNKCVKCYDNYHESGIYFQDSNLIQWQDEGISLGLDENHHLSAEAYKWIENRYETILSQL